MKVVRVSTRSFRNLQDGELAPSGGVNILFGDNAQGKTNLIEALWLFTGAKSFRGAKDGEMIRIGAERASVFLEFEAAGRLNEAKIEISAGRRARLNGVELESAASLVGAFRAVVFSPEHLGLVKAGPALRRRFLDAAICQLRPRYAASLMDYRRALAQRNALLKDIPRHSELLDTLEIWDAKLCAAGAPIVLTRLRYLKALGEGAAAVYRGIARGREEIDFSYCAAEGGDYPSPEEANGAVSLFGGLLAQKLREGRAGDIECGFTRSGPHRDDFLIGLDGLSARLYGSQGQQRSIALALKLAEAALLQKAAGEPPVLLLDDVLSELDGMRRDYLLNHIGGWQVFITCCDPADYKSLGSGRIFEVKGGAVSAR